jgi:hypothetical protein
MFANEIDPAGSIGPGGGRSAKKILKITHNIQKLDKGCSLWFFMNSGKVLFYFAALLSLWGRDAFPVDRQVC